MISFQANLALKETFAVVNDMNQSCRLSKVEARSFLRFLKTECESKRLAWQVYVNTKKLAQKRGLLSI